MYIGPIGPSQMYIDCKKNIYIRDIKVHFVITNVYTTPGLITWPSHPEDNTVQVNKLLYFGYRTRADLFTLTTDMFVLDVNIINTLPIHSRSVRARTTELPFIKSR